MYIESDMQPYTRPFLHQWKNLVLSSTKICRHTELLVWVIP